MFHFKQFSIEDKGATMKVGTDAVLLGASVAPSVEPTHILDIGTGCGILALMMAQRFPNAIIDAIDIEPTTATVASNNFKMSPWMDRIRCFNISLQDYSPVSSNKYDIIISNPPYFTNSLQSSQPRKNIARHTGSLSSSQLFKHSAALLSTHGIIAIIIPSTEIDQFNNAAENHCLIPIKTLNICTSSQSTPKRTIISYALNGQSSIQSTNTSPTTHQIYDINNLYSDWYRKTTEPFLLWKERLNKH